MNNIMKKQIILMAALLGTAVSVNAQSYQMNVYTNAGVVSYDASAVVKVDYSQKPSAVDTIPAGTDLAAYINGNAVFDSLTNVVFPLEEGGSYTQSAPIVVPTGASLTISGKQSAIQFTGDAGYVTAGGLVLSGIVIDASASANPLIELSTAPDENSLNLIGGAGGYYFIASPVSLLNSEVKGLNSYLLSDNNTKYCVTNFTVDNCIINMSTTAAAGMSATAFIYFKAGGIKDLTVCNSTLYQTGESDAKFFVQYNNSARLDRYGYDKNTQTQSVNFVNNTFYNMCKSGQWCNYNGIGGQKYSAFNVENNIWVNCTTTGGGVARRICGGRNASTYTVCVFNNNTYGNYVTAEDGTVSFVNETGVESYDTGTVLTSDPAFKDAANADFTPTGEQQVAAQTGDGRWFK
jgi:hypothetical protein